MPQVRLVVGPHQTASLCRESAGEGSPIGWEQLAVDLMDGFGGDLRLRMCVLKHSVGMLTNLSFSPTNLGASSIWTTANTSEAAAAGGNTSSTTFATGPMDLTRDAAVKCTHLDYPGAAAPPRLWLCEHSFGNGSAVLDGSGVARLIHADLSNCAAQQATSMDSAERQAQVCRLRLVGLTLLSGSTRGDMLARSAADKASLASSWAGMRAVCGACAPSAGVLGVGCHGGGLLFHSSVSGGVLEVVNTTFLNNSAQCGGALMVTGDISV
jgi:hypothetical protein